MNIKDIFCFGFPIGWDELGVIATVAAVIIALVANKKATQQLNSALKMQEQSKNVELLDRRMSMIETIISGNEISQISLQVLFNKEIDNQYQSWKNHLKERTCAEHEMQMFCSESSTWYLDNNTHRTVQNAIIDFERQIGMKDCTEEVHDAFIKFCDEHEIVHGHNEDGELITLNYLEIKECLDKESESEKKEKELTINLMKEFVSKSIQKIDS